MPLFLYSKEVGLRLDIRLFRVRQYFTNQVKNQNKSIDVLFNLFLLTRQNKLHLLFGM